MGADVLDLPGQAPLEDPERFHLDRGDVDDQRVRCEARGQVDDQPVEILDRHRRDHDVAAGAAFEVGPARTQVGGFRAQVAAVPDLNVEAGAQMPDQEAAEAAQTDDADRPCPAALHRAQTSTGNRPAGGVPGGFPYNRRSCVCQGREQG